MNVLETEHSNLEIDSKLNWQPVKTYKWRCDEFTSWQWAHQSDCRVWHPLDLAKVRSSNTIQQAIAIVYSRHHYCLNNRLSLFKAKKSLMRPILCRWLSPDWQVLLMGVFMLRWLSDHVPWPGSKRCILQTLSRDQYWTAICLSVLSSFSFSLSAVIQVLMSRMQSCNVVTASNSLALEPGLNEI